MNNTVQQPLPFETPLWGQRCTVKVELNKQEALRYLGYTGQEIDENLLDRFNSLAQEAQEKLSVSYIWRIFEIDEENSRWLSKNSANTNPCIALNNSSLVLPGSSINRHMIGARALVLLACTLGLASERELRTKNALNATDALLFNAATSSLVEAGANYASEEIAAFAEQHQLYSGLRFSPGYGDLPLALQSEFAKTLDLKRTLGITVTPENLLIPLKSITAFVGLFDTPPKQSYRSPCKDCPAKQSCTYKERGLRCYD